MFRKMQNLSQIEQRMTALAPAAAPIPAAVHHRAGIQAVASQENVTELRNWSLADVAVIVAASIALLIPAFLNGFPFLYPDSRRLFGVDATALPEPVLQPVLVVYPHGQVHLEHRARAGADPLLDAFPALPAL